MNLPKFRWRSYNYDFGSECRFLLTCQISYNSKTVTKMPSTDTPPKKRKNKTKRFEIRHEGSPWEGEGVVIKLSIVLLKYALKAYINKLFLKKI